mmetsp:Transcript_119272/g.337384  ORF Transcript_119272/g.337384 Transcript_119272/m.337384 type:complete len:694 (-) Transcript_119272:126-2207(-)
MSRLQQRPERPTRAYLEPLRPADPKWRGRNGHLRADLGPIFPIREVNHYNGNPALHRLDDGSCFAFYPSGQKAVCSMCYHKSRRVSVVCYSSIEFTMKSAVPDVVHEDDDAEASDAAAATRKKRRTRHLGALDGWGIGTLETFPEPSGARGCYDVSVSHVSVRSPSGQQVKVSRDDVEILKANAGLLQLRLNGELTVSYDPKSGVSIVDFNSEGVQHTFHAGEVWRMAPGSMVSPSAPTTTVEEVMNGIQMGDGAQVKLDAASENMLDTVKTLMETSRNASRDASSMTQLSMRTLSKSNTEPALRDVGMLEHTAKRLCDGRIEWEFEHKMKKDVRKLRVDCLPARNKVPRSLSEGYTYPEPPLPKPHTVGRHSTTPCSLQSVTASQVEELASICSGKSTMLIVLVVADWAASSSYSSCYRARTVAESAYGELIARGDGERVKIVAAELSEAGAIYSTSKYVNPLKETYGVKAAPWLLVFDRGKCVFSDNPAADDLGEGSGRRPEGFEDIPGGGLGLSMRMRNQPAFARPRVLVLEPPWDPGPDGVVKRGNNFRLQLETQEVLKRLRFQFDLCLNAADGMRLAGNAEPPYGIFLCTSEAGPGALVDIASRIRQRSSKAISFICHDSRVHGELGQQFQSIVLQKDLVQGVFERPLTKSALDKVLWPRESVRINYPKCGMTKKSLLGFISRRLSGV